MNAIARVSIVALGLVPLLSQAAPPYAGATFDVLVYENRTGAPAQTCIHFDSNGRFSMASETLSMRWAAQIDDETAFLAVTEPGDRVVLPYHMAIHGSLGADGRLVAAGIDESGDTFVMHGKQTRACALDHAGPATIGARAGSPIDAIRDPAHTGKMRFRDRCYAPPGWAVICDPVPNPLVATVDAIGATGSAGLAGRSFRLALETTGLRTREYCWSFESDGTIESTKAGRLTWASKGRTDAGFQSVGAGNRAFGIGYHGQLVDETLLRVVGIEARDGRAVVAYGHGQAVDGCD